MFAASVHFDIANKEKDLMLLQYWKIIDLNVFELFRH